MEVESVFFNTSDFEIKANSLGRGQYGSVYIAEKKSDHQKYAAKVINVEKFDGWEQMLFLRESLILHMLDHPSIVKFIGINFKSFSNPKILQPTIITEFLSKGSLRDNLNKERDCLSDLDWTPTKKYIILLGVSDALRYLHEQNILHRDLKPENILIDSECYPRVCDFGLSKCFPESLTESTKLCISGRFGTPLYLPPEILREDKKYDKSVDVYAFGMIAYEIVTGKLPFSDLDDSKGGFSIINRIINGERPKFPSFVTEKMKNLISRCWSQQPEERPTFKDIFDELSNDFSYFDEKVDDVEVQDYLDMLDEHRSEQTKNESNATKKLRKSFDAIIEKKDEEKNDLLNELQELKLKISEINDKQKSLTKSNNSFYYGILSILGYKKQYNTKDAIEKLKLSSEQGNCYASFILGLLYEVGKDVERKKKKSIMYYELSSKQGYSKGFYRIGYLYNYGINVAEDLEKAIFYYSKAADLDDDEALDRLGQIYDNKEFSGHDCNKAFKYYEKAAELGNGNALYCVGSFYYSGDAVEKNYAKAIEYYEKAAKLGNSNAFNNLGVIYKLGQGVEQDYSKAFEYFEKAAELNNTSGIINLGHLYLKGDGVEQDCSKAIEYFEKAAELNEPSGLYYLGYSYMKGKNVEQDYSKAIQYFERSGELGYAEAFLDLGYIFAYVKNVDKDYSKAIEYYKRAGELGHSEAFYKIGCIYKNEYNDEQNYSEAIKYFEKACELGDIDASYELYYLYLNGERVEQNLSKAFYYKIKGFEASNRNSISYVEFYKEIIQYKATYEQCSNVIKFLERKAELKDSNAAYYLAKIFLIKRFFNKNHSKGIEYLEKAAQLDDERACFKLVTLYKEGKYVEKNYSKVIEYLEKSGKLDNSNAFFELGQMYETGDGVEKDFTKAIDYYEKSAKLSNKEAKEKLDNLLKKE